MRYPFVFGVKRFQDYITKVTIIDENNIKEEIVEKEGESSDNVYYKHYHQTIQSVRPASLFQLLLIKTGNSDCEYEYQDVDVSSIRKRISFFVSANKILFYFIMLLLFALAYIYYNLSFLF